MKIDRNSITGAGTLIVRSHYYGCRFPDNRRNQDKRYYGPITRYVKMRVAQAPGMSGTFSPPLRVSDTDMHHGTCATHVPWCMPGSPTSGLLWSRRRRKRSRHSWRMRNPQFYVSGKRPMALIYLSWNILAPITEGVLHNLWEQTWIVSIESSVS